MKLIYTTCENKEQARDLAKQLLAKKLIACANILEIDSVYEYEGSAKETAEHALILKTADNTAEKAKQWLAENHPYETPAILEIPVTANSVFDTWVSKQTD